MDSLRWLITTLKGVYVVENFLLGWSPRLRSSPPSCRKTLRWYLHWNSGELQVTSEACSMSTYRSSPKGQPLHQRNSSELSNDAESPKAPSNYFSRNSQFYYNYSTQLPYVHESNSTYSTHTYSTTQLHPVSVPSQAIPHAIRSRDQFQDNGRRPHR